MFTDIYNNDGLKRHVLDVLGYGVNAQGIVYDQETFALLSYKGKFLSFNKIDILERKKVYFDLFNIGIMYWLFQLFMYNFQKENPEFYIQVYYEDIIRDYPVDRSAMIFKDNETLILKTWYYVIPTFKFIEVMYNLSEMYKPDELIRYDNSLNLLYYQEFLEKQATKKQKEINKKYKK